MTTETNKSNQGKATSLEALLKDIRRNTKLIFISEQKVLIIMESIRGELSVAELCLKYGISDSTYYKWNKETNAEVQELHTQNQDLKLALAELVQFKVKRGTIDELRSIGISDGHPIVIGMSSHTYGTLKYNRL